jgi:hypothetical protein
VLGASNIKEAVFLSRVWVGVDAGKGFHWAVAIDEEGEVLISRKAHNDEADLSALVEEALSLGPDLVWATDQPGGSTALLLALLWEREQRVVYAPGVAVNRPATPTVASLRPTPVTLGLSRSSRRCAGISLPSNPVLSSSPN